MLVYRRSFTFDVPRDEIWSAVCSVESFDEWAKWMRDLRVIGDGIAPGTVFTFGVVSRLPYRMDLEIEIKEVKERELVEADVRRDLHGTGRLHLRDAGRKTEVELSWEVEVISRTLRTLLFVSGPFVRWTQDWAVRAAVSGTRRRLREQGKLG